MHRIMLALLTLVLIACGTTSTIPVVTPKPDIVVPPYAEIAKNASDMTEAQWKVYSASLVGGQFLNWTGWIVDVETGRDGIFLVKMALEPPGTPLRTYKVTFNLAESQAISLNKNQRVIFNGTIVSVENPLGECYIKASGVTITLATD